MIERVRPLLIELFRIATAAAILTLAFTLGLLFGVQL